MIDFENGSGIDLFNGLDGGSYAVASDSDAVLEVTLDTIHNDIQLMHFSILAIFCIVFIMFCVRKWR